MVLIMRNLEKVSEGPHNVQRVYGLRYACVGPPWVHNHTEPRHTKKKYLIGSKSIINFEYDLCSLSKGSNMMN